MKKFFSISVFACMLLAFPGMFGAEAFRGESLNKLDEAYFALSAEGGSNYFEATPTCTSPLPVPSGQQLTMTFNSVQNAITSFDVARSRPIGVGSFATGGDTVTIRVGLSTFQNPVDVYFAIGTSLQPDHLLTLQPDNSFEDFSPGSLATVLPWKGSTKGPVSQLLTSLPVSSIPPGDYTFYLLVTPPGRTDNFFLWATEISVP